MTSKSTQKSQLNAMNEDHSNNFLRAKRLVQSYGHILSLYSSAIRTISAAPSVLKTEENKQIDSFAQSTVKSPISISPTLSQSFQLAASELYPKEYAVLNSNGKPHIKDVIKIMSANELAAVLGITYFYKLLAKSTDSEELSRITPLLSAYLKNGAIIGAQLGSSFGRGGGLAAAGLRVLGLACLIKADLKAFKSLRRMIDDNAELDNLDFERQHFGFSHLDVASVLAGELGYGPIAREAFINYQLKIQPSSPQAIFWRHTLVETTKLWQERINKKVSEKKKNAIGTFEDIDGYKWLWNQTVSQDILPGIDNADLEMINSSIPKSQDTQVISKQNLNILIVEDEQTSASILNKIVADLGTITICSSGEEALRVISDKDNPGFDILFLDVSLTGISGLEVLNSYREMEVKNGISEELSSLIFILTSDENPQTVMKSFAHGANGYLTKPFNKQTIFQELHKFGL